MRHKAEGDQPDCCCCNNNNSNATSGDCSQVTASQHIQIKNRSVCEGARERERDSVKWCTVHGKRTQKHDDNDEGKYRIIVP